MDQSAHSVLFNEKTTGYYDNTNTAAPNGDGLQFYASNYNDPTYMTSSYYGGSTNSALSSSLHHTAPPSSSTGGINVGPTGSIQDGLNFRQSGGGFWSAFGTGGFEDEPPLLEEIGINLQHIQAKSLTVLNPFKKVSETIMDDADLAGPLLFIFLFGIFLMLSGKVHFGYIYGVGVLGVVSIYLVLNLMSEDGVDWSRTASVLGYCLLPMVMLSGFSVVLKLGGIVGLVLSFVSIFWCTWSSSAMFTATLRMNDQRLLVSYPVGLFYACFALMTVF
ncbi:Yip1-domain-containing protein [Absidia repens]|uniref:Protein YIP n=1 Tax=Absidia repens TaxID=90262 RepID=A0A1X2ITA9_9FUNG|nr:Yip1-domain-containing protein [Absidia repens]